MSQEQTNFYVMLGTFSLAITGWIQAWISQQTSQRQLRAYLSVKECQFQLINNKYSYGIIVLNSGQTPASNVVNKIASKIVDYPITEILTPINEDNCKSYIGPGQGVVFSYRDENINAEDKNALLTGGKALYVSVEISYTDAFGKEHYLRFQRIKTGPQGFHDPVLNLYGEDEAS